MGRRRAGELDGQLVAVHRGLAETLGDHFLGHLLERKTSICTFDQMFTNLSICREFQGEEALVTDTTTTADREDMDSNILCMVKEKITRRASSSTVIFPFPDPSSNITRSKITSNYVCVLVYYYMWG